MDMMDIQSVPFYLVPFHLVPVDTRLYTCATLGHFCPQLSKLSIIS